MGNLQDACILIGGGGRANKWTGCFNMVHRFLQVKTSDVKECIIGPLLSGNLHMSASSLSVNAFCIDYQENIDALISCIISCLQATCKDG